MSERRIQARVSAAIARETQGQKPKPLFRNLAREARMAVAAEEQAKREVVVSAVAEALLGIVSEVTPDARIEAVETARSAVEVFLSELAQRKVSR